MSEEINKVKAEFEEKIKDYSEKEKSAAKSAWNATLDKVRAVLSAKVAQIGALKVADTLINSKLQALSATKDATSNELKSKVVNPASKMLSQYSSKTLSNLKNEISDANKGSDNYSSTAKSISNRNAFNKTKIDEREKKLKENIDTIDKLKYA